MFLKNFTGKDLCFDQTPMTHDQAAMTNDQSPNARKQIKDISNET